MNPYGQSERDVHRRQTRTSFDFSSPLDVGQTAGTLFEDVDALNDGDFHAYRVFAVNACGVEAP